MGRIPTLFNNQSTEKNFSLCIFHSLSLSPCRAHILFSDSHTKPLTVWAFIPFYFDIEFVGFAIIFLLCCASLIICMYIQLATEFKMCKNYQDHIFIDLISAFKALLLVMVSHELYCAWLMGLVMINSRHLST